jgi:hypothetical protein
MPKNHRSIARDLARQQFELSGPIEAAIEDLSRQTTRGIALWVASGRDAGDDIEGALTAGRWTLRGAQRAYAAEYRRLCRR